MLTLYKSRYSMTKVEGCLCGACTLYVHIYNVPLLYLATWVGLAERRSQLRQPRPSGRGRDPESCRWPDRAGTAMHPRL